MRVTAFGKQQPSLACMLCYYGPSLGLKLLPSVASVLFTLLLSVHPSGDLPSLVDNGKGLVIHALIHREPYSLTRTTHLPITIKEEAPRLSPIHDSTSSSHPILPNCPRPG